MSQVENYISGLLESSDEYDCYLVEVVSNNKKLEVYIDSDSGVNLKTCQSLSRKIEAYIEENKILPADYTLEVSSPGLDRPLKLQKQYTKNKNRKVKVKTQSSQEIIGMLEDVKENHIIVLDNNKKKTTLSWEEINETFVLPAF